VKKTGIAIKGAFVFKDGKVGKTRRRRMSVSEAIAQAKSKRVRVVRKGTRG
jgi:hypothetical protein